ncbi:MAG: hypothetical protein JWP88_2099 [Flaviaesturariibacter sp.]|nr:hypothetical protein [Flaviaesturariibacter sp.]
MTLFEFKLLDESDQLDCLYEQGAYIGKRKESYQNILLYQLEGFYVEVFYYKHRCYCTNIRCSQSTTLLDPYLEDINVEHLV